MAGERGKLGDGFIVRVPSKAKVTTSAKTEERRKGPYPVDEEDLRPPPQQLKIIISDISTRNDIQNRINNGTVSTVGLGRAVIGVQQSKAGNINWAGDTYGASVVIFDVDTIAEANEMLLRDLLTGGG
jgi:hypothetical protein